jgi:stress response protein SCP2
LIPHLKSYSRDIIPTIRIDPNEKVALMRKDGVIRISDYYCPPPHQSLDKADGGGNHNHGRVPSMVTFGLAWDVTNGRNIDLDASAICLDADLNEVETVSFRKLQSTNGSILHGGDEREGDAIGDDEKIHFKLKAIDPKVKYIGIVINSYSGQELDDIAAASCHLFDSSTGRDIARYALTNASELDKRTGLIMACLFRGTDGGTSSVVCGSTTEVEWYLRIMSFPCNGLVASALVDDFQLLLAQNPPKSPPVIIVEDEDEECEIDLSMPMRVQHNEDEEIVVLPFEDLKKITLQTRAR